MNILGNKLLLRAIEEEDLRQLHVWANDPEIWRNLGGWHMPSNFDSMLQWFANLKNDKVNQRWAVTLKDTGQLIGTANLVTIDWKNNNAFHGVMFGKEFRGQGYGKDAVMAVMRYAFDELNLNRIDTDIIEHNVASLKLYESCGWKQEGRMRQWHYREGRYWDKFVMGVLREDYNVLVEKTGYWK